MGQMTGHESVCERDSAMGDVPVSAMNRIRSPLCVTVGRRVRYSEVDASIVNDPIPVKGYQTCSMECALGLAQDQHATSTLG